jgi:hypothetical protein
MDSNFFLYCYDENMISVNALLAMGVDVIK